MVLVSEGARVSVISLFSGLAIVFILQLLLSQYDDGSTGSLGGIFTSMNSLVGCFAKNGRHITRASTTPLLSTNTLTILPPSSRAFASSSVLSTTSKTDAFLQAIQDRRSLYKLNNQSPISDDRIEHIVKHAVLHVPSSFNSQSARLVLLLKKEHEQFWDLVKEALKPLTPAENFGATKEKLNGFRAGYGTILFFEDAAPIHALQKKFEIYADKFPQWSEHTSAMHQYALWVALELEGFGANLQHYNPVVDKKVQDQWKIPKEWSLKAQLVFGGKAGEAGTKEQQPLDDRLKVFGK